MSNILLVEPDYRSKFPPLGLLRIAAYHKCIGDCVSFTRGKVQRLRNLRWHKVYISSLFTYELPRTIKTAQYYLPSVDHPSDIVIGGIGATLMPDYIKERISCTVITGALDRPGMLTPDAPAIERFVPDYSVLDCSEWQYEPKDSYFLRVTKGCIRNCRFCAVPKLEPRYSFSNGILAQVQEIDRMYGEKQNMIIMDNNILASEHFENVIAEILDLGFNWAATRNGRKRIVDFNQGIDARLITKKKASLLGRICIHPVRLALDYDAMIAPYSKAVTTLCSEGIEKFTTYVMFNYLDSPQSFYKRLSISYDLSKRLGAKITSFPMKYAPIDDVKRHHVAQKWKWRYLRGIQCVLLATHGLVGPSHEFFQASFGHDLNEFLEIVCMPDRYIIHRDEHRYNGASIWKRMYRRLSESQKEEFLALLEQVHFSPEREKVLASCRKYRSLLDHYYPNGHSPESY